MATGHRINSRMGLVTDSVVRALIMSILVHATVFGIWKLGQSVHLWERMPIFSFLSRIPFFSPSAMAAKLPKPPLPLKDVELTFIEVDPSAAVAKAPKNARFYSSVSTEAADQTRADKNDSSVPKILGTQKEFLKITENKVSHAQPLKPSPPAENTKDNKEQEARSKPQQPPGDLAVLKPEDRARKDEGKKEEKGDAEETTHHRPSTVAEAKAGSIGERSQTEHGVGRIDLSGSLAAKGTITGEYDWRFVEAVRDRWYTLLEQVNNTVRGKVVVEFNLLYDGRVTDTKVTESTVGEMQSLLCEKAILDPQPYPRWPNQMRMELKGDSRNVTMTFYYQ